MIRNAPLPRVLNDSLDYERKDFAVKAGRDKPFLQSIGLLLFGTFWTAFTCVFIGIFLGPLLSGKEVEFDLNGVPTVASPENLEPIVLPAIFLGIFLLIGIVMLARGVHSAFKQGGYFVGTPQRLVHFRKGRIRSIDWEQFSGDITLSGSNEKGTVSLQMRTGKMVRRKNSPDRYVPEVIHMTRIPYAVDIEKICRKRIKENDPTPPVQ
jgi:hypothetical protein